MATQRQQRGRAAPTKKRSPLPYFYGLLALIAIVGGSLVLNQRQAPAPSQPSSEIVRTLNAPVGVTAEGFAYKGDPNAPVKVIEYADFQCPACGYFFQTIESSIDQTYIESGKVQLIFHDFPLPQHQNAVATASAARCAAAQNAFWPMHDLLFARQDEWESDRNIQPRLESYAAELKLDSAAFSQCLADPTTTSAINAAATASTERGVTGTPSFDVNGQLVDATQLEAAIQAALSAGGR
jgi:protein-disulfide isomerase